MRLGEATDRMNVEDISSGFPCYRYRCCGEGASLAARAVIEIYGPETSGKINSSASRCSLKRKNRWHCGFIDAEHAMDLYMLVT